MVNQEAVDTLVQTVLFEEYAKSPQFVVDKTALYSAAVSSDQQIDDYLQACVAQGVDIKSATTCVILFLKLKLSENAS